MEETQTTTLPAEGSPEGTGSLETENTSQEATQPQDAGVAKVEANGQSASSKPSERPVSDYFRQREKIRALESQLQEMQQRFQASQQRSSDAKPQVQQPNPDDYWKDPIAFQAQREKQLREEIRKEILENDVPKFLTERETKLEKARREQEALELMFPKDSTSPNLTLEERIAKDEAKASKLLEIMQREGLDAYSEINPAKAAKWTLMIYEQEQAAKAPAKNPLAPKKGQMVSTATGVQTNGGARKMNYSEIKAKVDEMNQKFSENPELRFNEKLRQERDLLKSELSKLAKEGAVSQ